jgi:excinuclease UvrABC ATPase subunit
VLSARLPAGFGARVRLDVENGVLAATLMVISATTGGGMARQVSTDNIRVVGARENNLKDVSVSIAKNRITVFVGVSGSGKSSLVFDTIAVEAQRQLNATYPWSIRNQLPAYERPHVDALENLTTPVVVDQRPLGGNVRSTVGTITDIYAMIRLLFSRYGSPSAGPPSAYSFNDPAGMCPECDGIGRAMRPDLDLMLDKSKSLAEGAILLPGYPVGSPGWQFYANYEGLDATKKLSKYTTREMDTFLHGSEGKVQLTFKNGKTQLLSYEGLVTGFVRRHLNRDTGTLSAKTREMGERFVSEGPCLACSGDRLVPAALATTIDGRNIADYSRMQISDLIEHLPTVEDPAGSALVKAIGAALDRIDAIGLGYLSLDRSTPTLSGGEGQRLKLVKHLGSDLSGLTYYFDEPSIGLHPHDVGRLNHLLKALRDKGNTILVVEHDPDVFAVADHVIEMGPLAGADGGEVVFAGTLAQLRKADTATGSALRVAAADRRAPRKAAGRLPLRKITLHNLDKVSVDIPTGLLTAVTGVAGSGKSSLISAAFCSAYPATIAVDQSPIAASSRSTPATYLGLLDPIRKLFAKATGVEASLFSFNSKGACDECQGRGVIITEIAFMDPITTHCETCGGRRFKDSVLELELRGKSIADVLELSAVEATDFFTEKAVLTKLEGLIETGLGYLGLGQSLSTLSAGERQRIKLADQLHAEGNVYVLDEPTTGLHLRDIATLLALLDSMVDRGNTVIVIEHNLAVVEHADWVIDLGPEGGKNGGRIMFTGTPHQLAASSTLTGRHLKEHLST